MGFINQLVAGGLHIVRFTDKEWDEASKKLVSLCMSISG